MNELKKILIVDDEPLVRRSLRRVFHEKFLIFEAEDGLAGIKLWKEEKPNLVFLDILLPGMTGPEILKGIDLELKNNCKVILISAYTGGYNLESAKNIGADLFIAKPFENIFEVKEQAEILLKEMI